jgi:hypothetical protein
MTTDEAIQAAAFWSWFKDRHEQIAAAYEAGDNDWLHANITPRVKGIEPRLNWEMGPYHHPDHTFVISPSVRDNIALAERVVAEVPAIPGWHFLPAKPPKELRRLVIELHTVEGAEVDADGWSYRLIAYNRMEFFDIEVFTDDTVPIADDDLELLTHRLIESLVGERLYLERIAHVEVYRPSAEGLPEKRVAFPLLGRHLAHLLGQQGSGVEGTGQ